MTPKERNDLLTSMAAKLAENHDSVVIVVTFPNGQDQGTGMLSVGAGNGFAQRKSIEDAGAMANIRAMKHV